MEKNDLYMNWLTDERYTWRYELKQGLWHEPYVLQQYRANRDSNLWRTTREVEKLCELILHLEGANTMSEYVIVTCDKCHTDISTSDTYPTYRIRLGEEIRQINPGAKPVENPAELSRMMNFCNLTCLNAWINRANDAVQEPEENADIPQ